MTTTFDAPRTLVFEAHSTCEHMKHWWGPRRFEMVVCEIDFRPGGTYRIVHRGADGDEFGFRGEFREIVPPERIVWTRVPDNHAISAGQPAIYSSSVRKETQHG